MTHALQPGNFTFTIIARTGGQFADFAPYVPSISDDGLVAFQASLTSGGSGIFTGRGTAISTIIDPHGPFTSIDSHPDINRHGDSGFYATLKSGGQGVFLVRAGRAFTLAPSHGPLGPTINDHGTVAFRANLDSGDAGIFIGDDGSRPITTIADTTEVFSAFHGIPVINAPDGGAVVFRADLKSGGQVIEVRDSHSRFIIAATGEMFSSLGQFPMMNDSGAVVFCATQRLGTSGIFVAANGSSEAIIDTSAGFEGFRGALINSAGRVVFYATPVAGTLGIYTGGDPRSGRLLGIGSPLFDSTVADFALNPVSINNAGQLAVRVALADGGQFIVRADPV